MSLEPSRDDNQGTFSATIKEMKDEEVTLFIEKVREMAAENEKTQPSE